MAGALVMQQGSAPYIPASATPTVTATPAVAGVRVAPGVIVAGASDPVLGDAGAPITMFIFTQFHCPFCRHFFEATWPHLQENFIDTGRVRLVFKPFPIGDDEKSPEATEQAAEAALCAHEQHDFWPYLNHLYAVDAGYEARDFKGYAQADGLDISAFMACLYSQAYAEVVATNIREAVAAGITGTPTFVIHDQLYEGALSYAELASILRSL